MVLKACEILLGKLPDQIDTSGKGIVSTVVERLQISPPDQQDNYRQKFLNIALAYSLVEQQLAREQRFIEGTPFLLHLGHQQYEACIRNIVFNPLAIERLASPSPDDKHSIKLSNFIRERASGLEANQEELLVKVLDFSIQQEAEYRERDEIEKNLVERKKSMHQKERQSHLQELEIELEIKKNTLQQQRKILLEKIQKEFPRYVYLLKNSCRLSEEDLELIEEAKRYRHPEIHAQTGRLNKLKSELHSSKCELFDAIQQQNLTKLELSVF